MRTTFIQIGSSLKRSLVHCMVLYVTGFVAYQFWDTFGQWVMLMCGAILIGDEPRGVLARGTNGLIGVALGSLTAFILIACGMPQLIRGCLVVAAILLNSKFMPKAIKEPHYYIVGSACVSIATILGMTLGLDTVSKMVAGSYCLGLSGNRRSLHSLGDHGSCIMDATSIRLPEATSRNRTSVVRF